MTELRDAMARAMRAQGKVEPESVFAQADQIDLEFGRCDECGRPLTTEEAIRSDACLQCDPPALEEAPVPEDWEERGYGWEP